MNSLASAELPPNPCSVIPQARASGRFMAGEQKVELKPNMSFDLHCAIDSFREMQGANIETIVDSFLQDFRRCDPFVQSEGAGNVPTFALWVGPLKVCLLYTSPSPRDGLLSRMPSSA